MMLREKNAMVEICLSVLKKYLPQKNNIEIQDIF